MEQIKEKLSNWDKPGGTLGKIVVVGLIALGGLALYKALPFLLAITWGALELAIAGSILFALIAVLTNKKFKKAVSALFFMAMRKLTGIVVELDPIAIMEQRLQDMKKKLEEVREANGRLKGTIGTLKSKKDKAKKDFEDNMRLGKELYKKEETRAMGEVRLKQAARDLESYKMTSQMLAQSEAWYENLKQMEDRAKICIEDVENDINHQKAQYELLKTQHKAFKSIMNIMGEDADEMEMFNMAVDTIQRRSEQMLGEMEHAMESSSSIVQQFKAEQAVESIKASELLARYDEKMGIEGLLEPSAQTMTMSQGQSAGSGASIDNYFDN